MTISQQVAKITSQQKSIYLVIGQNEFWESRILERLQQLIPITEQTMNFASYDLEATSLGTALNDARSLPFFGNHRIVVIKNAAFLTGQAKSTASPAEISDLLKYLQQPVAETTLVIFAPYEKLDSRKKNHQRIKKNRLKSSILINYQRGKFVILLKSMSKTSIIKLNRQHSKN
ncbi:hypothetical protein [Lactobacillus florum]|uniref:DNA polymerase III subunit delta n=1 Tax=Fructilactobacillus florum TaxID=640331 RepID=UPI0006D197AA